MYQHWPLVIKDKKPGLDPVAHRSLENAVQVGSFVHRVVAVDFGVVGIVAAFVHGYRFTIFRT